MLRFAFRYMITDRSTAWINGHRIRWQDSVGDHLPAEVSAP
jgi:hypothetical protein